MRIADKLLCAGLLAAGCFAQGTRPQARDITLLEGRGELLTFQADINKVAISEPKVADAVVISPRELMVNAKGPGRATLVVWETGVDPVRYEIAVAKDTTEWDLFTKSFSDAAGAPITVTGTGETIVLSGTVKSAEDSKKLAGMAQTRAKNVINLLQAPPPPELRQILLQVKFAAIDRVALTTIGFNLFSTNPKLVGAVSTEQFAAPRFSQLTPGTGLVGLKLTTSKKLAGGMEVLVGKMKSTALRRRHVLVGNAGSKSCTWLPLKLYNSINSSS